MSHEHFSNKELIAFFIGEKTTERLYKGSLHALFAPKGDVIRAHQKFSAMRELVRRWQYELLQRGPTLANPKNTREYLRIHHAGLEHEVFTILFLDNRNRVIVVEDMFRGTIDGATIHPREIVKRSLQLNAAAVILAHNHPSGVAEPSQSDEVITRRVKEALAVVDIRVLDHLVVGDNHVESMAERGML